MASADGSHLVPSPSLVKLERALEIVRARVCLRILATSLALVIMGQLEKKTPRARPSVDDSFATLSIPPRQRPLLGAAVVDAPSRCPPRV